MFKFFEAIASIFITVVNFIVNMFELIIVVISNIARAVSWLFLCIGYLPPWLVAFVIVPVSLAVIFQVINKGS